MEVVAERLDPLISLISFVCPGPASSFLVSFFLRTMRRSGNRLSLSRSCSVF